MTNTRALCLLLITRPRSSLATYFLFLLTMNPYISIKWFTFINHITHQVHHFTSICLPPLKPSFTSQKKSKILNQLLFTSRQDTRLSISVLDSFFFFFSIHHQCGLGQGLEFKLITNGRYSKQILGLVTRLYLWVSTNEINLIMSEWVARLLRKRCVSKSETHPFTSHPEGLETITKTFFFSSPKFFFFWVSFYAVSLLLRGWVVNY